MPTPAQPQTPQAAPRPAIAEQPASIGALQSQAVDLTAQLAGLRVEQRVLRSQINSRGWDASTHPEQLARYAEVNAKITRAEADLERVRLQIAQQTGVPTAQIGSTGQLVPPPAPRFNRSADPDMVVGVSFVLALSFVLPISIAIAKRVWRGKSQAAAPMTDEIAPRLDRLEQAVDAVAIEIERISESQRFVTRILAERPRPGANAPAAPATQDAAAERPILALGAGPMEPVRAQEREGIRQVVTPH
ncbi:MAG TPA: hypothetical protein VLN49_08880 [Gemmatimonadaceae bacterium]|nr:hypothetical protein [Gemmatimonadaceae bacterium]